MSREIYALIDPRDNAVRYVGVTSQALEMRLAGHIHDRQLSTPKGLWANELFSLGLRPLIVRLQSVGANWASAEREAIDAYRAAGHSLLNTTKGGKGRAAPHTEETRRKISAAKRGKRCAWRDCATRNARVSAAKRGKLTTPRHIRENVVALFKAGRSKRSISQEVGICRETIRTIIRANGQLSGRE